MTPEPARPPEPSDHDAELAYFLEDAFSRFARGESVRAAEMLADRPHLVRAGEQLLADARELFGAAVGLRDWSKVLRSEELDRTADETRALPVELGDPFPSAFRLLRPLGQGSFGRVWLAEDLHLNRQVALKMIRFTGPRGETERCLEQLRAEARLLAGLRHPNLVPVLTWQEGQDAQGNRTAALVMPFIPGGSLANRVRQEGPLPWPTAARYLADVADGLRAVHAAGLVHRDVKPANILWDSEADEALLTDFGLSTRLTEVMSAAGTPFYMPPEAFEGLGSFAQDVYGLAASLFWLITGSVPFPAREQALLLEQVRRGLPDPDPRCVDLPRPLERLLRSALTADPEGRPGLDDFAARLRGVLNHLLADNLPTSARQNPAPTGGVRLTVSRQVGRHTFVPIGASHPQPERLVRDLRRVPAEPDRVDLCTGERVRLAVETDRPGYVTVFNIGPTGNLNLLYPVSARPAAVEPGRPLPVVDVELTPPTGSERVFALWSRTPLPLRLDEMATLAQGGTLPVPESYHATRDLKRLQESVQELPGDDWEAVVVELNHLPPTEKVP
jgi:serine/threonine protein kinase